MGPEGQEGQEVQEVQEPVGPEEQQLKVEQQELKLVEPKEH